jgi:type I restriction-modification system DNA methylase subunit
VDASDFKAYVFPLLFLKRIGDVYAEEYEEALAEADGDEEYAAFLEQQRFQVPPGCRMRRASSTGAPGIDVARGETQSTKTRKRGDSRVVEIS